MTTTQNRRITYALAARVGIEFSDDLPNNSAGYPLFYLTDANTVLCAEHANIEGDYNDELINAADVNWEDPDLYCEHGERIPSAYAEDEAQS
jgi:hypothetical protein